MSMSDAAENAFLLLLFNATAWADIAQDDGSSPNTAIAYALATADPTDSGTMSSNEVTYTDYARVNVNRNSGGHTVTANSVSPAADVTFPIGSGGSGTVTHFSQGKPGGGATAIHFSGTCTPNIVTGLGITPYLESTSTTTVMT